MTNQADNVVPHAKVRNLRDAMRKVRLAEAERTDVIVELQETEKARLDILCEELDTIASEIPEEDDQFALQVMPGNPPRLWIDMTSHVVMARDRRTYRMVKDTRIGRTVILETDSVGDMADSVTEYIAERIIERERALESDWLLKRLQVDADKALAEAESRRKAQPRRRGRALLAALATFVLGAAIGAAGLVAYAWFFNPMG